jgi:hypothetical protein
MLNTIKIQKISLILFLLSSLSIFSQAPRGFHLMGGINQSSLKSSDLSSDSGVGYIAGINFNFGYNESYNYQIEASYINSNFNLKSVDFNQNFESISDSKYSYNHLALGFYFNYYILKPDEDKFFLGPQIGVAGSFGGSFIPKSGNVDSELYLPYLLDENDLTKVSGFNYNLGIGLTGGYNDFRFDLRYSHGMNNLLSAVETNSYNQNNLYTGPSLNGKLNTFSFTVSYRVNKLFGAE